MNIDDIWLLFVRTGKIEYYLKYKELKRVYDKENRRNSN